ncbi:hypothetical protein CMUS01_11992 [Colletotrichum musicola]|uniref:Uncharacterized protein n=1 Tax=Colletotrichum musicola TaxID=2175873 RepID=A0A8H6JRJ5_9PEZI|nr:hypothetical protein CMUS01_11992 [Colletotrichum musicola]
MSPYPKLTPKQATHRPKTHRRIAGAYRRSKESSLIPAASQRQPERPAPPPRRRPRPSNTYMLLVQNAIQLNYRLQNYECALRSETITELTTTTSTTEHPDPALKIRQIQKRNTIGRKMKTHPTTTWTVRKPDISPQPAGTRKWEKVEDGVKIEGVSVYEQRVVPEWTMVLAKNKEMRRERRETKKRLRVLYYVSSWGASWSETRRLARRMRS